MVIKTTLFVLLVIAFTPAFGVDPDSDAPALLLGRALSGTPLMNDLKDLCDTIGGRPTGSPDSKASIRWATRKFKEAGLERVTEEGFSVPLLWLPISAEVSVTSPRNISIRAVASPNSPSTAEGGLEGILVDAGMGEPEDFQKLGSEGKNAIALVSSNEMKSLADLFEEYLKNKPMLESARKAGVTGLLLQSTRPKGLLYRHPMTLSRSYASMPVALISREHGTLLKRLMERGAVRLRMTLQNDTGPAYESQNVVAEIRGNEKPEEIVLLGAHLDSWDLGTGAQDNGVNAAMIIDVARAFIELKLAPRRTIRFVLFTGEEQGMWGSAGYVHRHAGEMDNHIAAITFDTGSGRTTGFYLNGREELRKPLNRILQAASAMNLTDHSLEAVDGTDNFDFLLSGVPNLVANQIVDSYLPDYHAESDVFEAVDAREASINDAIAGVLLWGLANAPDRLAARQTRSQVEKLLHDSGLDEQMKAFDQWEDWQSGKRGEFRQ